MPVLRILSLLALACCPLAGQEPAQHAKPEVAYPDVIVAGKVKKIHSVDLERIKPEPGGKMTYVASFSVDLEVLDVEKGDAVKKGDVISARARWIADRPLEWSLDVGSSLRAERVPGKGGLVWVIPRRESR